MTEELELLLEKAFKARSKTFTSCYKKGMTGKEAEDKAREDFREVMENAGWEFRKIAKAESGSQ